MNAIISFLGGLGTAISGIFDFLLDIVFDLVYVVQLLGRFLGMIPTFFGWLPPELLAIVAAALSIAVIFKILGR